MNGCRFRLSELRRAGFTVGRRFGPIACCRTSPSSPTRLDDCTALKNLLRGSDTSLGQAGYCVACGRAMPSGPDICLGLLPGVSQACCGHGGVCEPYVVIGGQPDQDVSTIRNAVVIRGDAALRYFRERAA